MEQVDSEPEGAAFGTSATFSTSVPHHMLPLNHPMTGFEELLILNLPKNRRIAFTDFFPTAQSHFSSWKNCDLFIYFQEEMKSRGFTLRISLGRACASRSKPLNLGGFQTLYPITQVSLTCLLWALLKSAIWGIQSDNCTCHWWKSLWQIKADLTLTFTNPDLWKSPFLGGPVWWLSESFEHRERRTQMPWVLILDLCLAQIHHICSWPPCVIRTWR